MYRYSKLSLVVMIIAILAYTSISIEAYDHGVHGSASISRRVEIFQGGFIHIYDEIEFKPYTLTANISLQGYPYNGIFKIDVYDKLGRISGYNLSNGSLTISFGKPLDEGEEDTIYVSIVYRGLFDFKTRRGEPLEVTVIIPSIIPLYMNTTIFDFRVETLKSFSWTSATYENYLWTWYGEGFLSYQTTNVSSIPRFFNITFKGNFISAEILSFTKDVYVGWDGALRIESTYRLKSLSNTSIQTIDLPLIENATRIDAYDFLGNLRPISYKRAYSIAEVNLRYPLGYGEHTSFTISYEASRDYVDFSFLSINQRVRIPVYLEYPSYIGRYRINVHLPWTASIVDVYMDGLNASIIDRGGDKLSLEIDSEKLSSRGFLTISFNYTPFTVIGRYTGIAIAIALIALIPLRSVRARLKTSREAIAKPAIVKLLDELSKAYEDLFSLEDRVDSMIYDALRRGSYSEVRDIRSRYSRDMEGLWRRIARIEEEIARSNPKARSMISKIREVLSEADLAKEQLEIARRRYMSRSIGRAALERSERDYRRKMESVRGRIGRIIEDMKEIQR